MEPLSRAREKFSNATTKKGRSLCFRPFQSLYFNTNRFCAPSIKFIVFVFRRTAHRHESGRQTNRNGSIVVSLSPLIFLSMARNGNLIKICIKTKFCNDIRQSRNVRLIVLLLFGRFFFDFCVNFQHGVGTKYYCGNMHC